MNTLYHKKMYVKGIAFQNVDIVEGTNLFILCLLLGWIDFLFLIEEYLVEADEQDCQEHKHNP